MTLPGILLENKIRRCNNAINAVVDYYNIEKGRVYWQNYYLRQFRTDITLNKVKIEEDTEILEAAEVLKRAKSSLYKKKRLKIYFICFKNQKLPISKHIYEFYTLATVTKYF